MSRFEPTDVGWRLGRSSRPRGVELWCRYDRTTGVYGEQGSGKTLDLLAPALLAHLGAGLATLTKVDDLLLTAGRRQQPGHLGGPPRPIAVLDPFGAAPGIPELVWDPIAGCVDPQIAERRAKAFSAGTVSGAVTGGRQDNAARFYAAETAKVLQGFLHAAALTGRTLDHVLEWVANPVAAEQPAEILQQHPHAARFWDGLLAGALHGSPDTVGNTVTTVQQAMALFFQPDIRARCVPSPGRPATDLVDLITRQGTVYLLGRDDPYASAAPLMTAVAEHVLDTALQVATTSPHGRMTPCFLACLDELPSTTPLPTLRVRMANERALGLSFIYAAQTWKQMVVSYGEDEARSLFGLTNTLVVFGGGKDVHFYRELSDLLDDVRISRQTVTDGPGGIGTSRSGEDVRVLRPGDIRRVPERHALVVAGTAPPIIARLQRCLDGKDGQRLKAELDAARAHVTRARTAVVDVSERTAAALAYARDHRLTPGRDDHASGSPFAQLPDEYSW
ncbi:type IV secretory system conjugative DNA transfer family protein [Modestobacter altitudinis]|uniref:type IV secretory system conjugative DNA transfer family protein n=1 Tax=Modestobacter altitudinis TaxID=2213158 RepID=UPI00110CC28F|nr:TraM recognition domain-containing protein [Modestobacter altitudinis]